MQEIYLLTSLSNFKDHINMTSGTTYDHTLNRMIAAATTECEKFTKRKLRGRTYGANGLEAEYHDGQGHPRLYTRQKPIISVTSLYDDAARSFGSDTLKTASDYYIYSDMGIIQLNSDAVLGTVFSKGLANIQLIYTAGYDSFQIIDNTNDRIDFNESDGGSELTANLTGGVYTSSSLATHIKSAMESAGADTYTVTYNYQMSKFTIASDGSYLKLLWNTGSNTYRNAALTLGFDEDGDDTDGDGTVSMTADRSVLGIPGDLEQACLEITERMWQNSKYGQGRFDKKSEKMDQGGTLAWNQGAMPEHVREILNMYRRKAVVVH